MNWPELVKRVEEFESASDEEWRILVLVLLLEIAANTGN